jgi:hypothetical protein
MDKKYGARSGRHSLRSRKPKGYSYTKSGPKSGKQKINEDQRKHAQLHAIFHNEKGLRHKDLGLRKYARLQASIHCEFGPQQKMMTDPTMEAVLSQFGVNKGIKLFRQDGVDAVLK